jgi:hypothetical protein
VCNKVTLINFRIAKLKAEINPTERSQKLSASFTYRGGTVAYIGEQSKLSCYRTAFPLIKLQKISEGEKSSLM